MNVNEDHSSNPVDDANASPVAVDAEAGSPPVKAVRRKRAVKPVAEAASDVSPVDAAVQPPTAAEASEAVSGNEPAKKTVRKRRAPVAQAVDQGVEADESAPKAALVMEVSAPPRLAGPEELVVVSSVEAAASVASGDPAAPATDATGENRSERSRRRGRRRRGRDDAGPEQETSSFTAEDDDDEESGDAGEGLPVVRPVPAEAGEVFAQVLSGEFDVVEEASEPEPTPVPKRVLQPDVDAPKLHKVLAQAGVGSRRDMEQLILDGQITVNGQPAHIGQRISFGDQIKVDGKPIRVSIVPPPPRIIAYHKPVGEVVTHDDPQHRPTVFRRLPRLQRGKWQSVGRLDLNTEGLLLFTNSGELANQLMHPRFGVEREYAVRVLGTLEPDDKARLLEGVSIEGQTASFRSIEDGGGEGANHWYRVVITEGRNREVRKLFDAVGLTVSRLIRIRYGTVVLPRGLKRGVWVDLDSTDVQAIRRLAGGDSENRHARSNEQRDGRGGRNKPRNGRGDRPQQDRGPAQGGRGPNDRGQRHAQQGRSVPAEGRRDDDFEDDFDPMSIPNPLEQTFDKRFVQNPRSPAGGRGFRNGGGGFGAGGSGPGPAAPKRGGGPREPDPLQTSVGYIGADAFHRKGNRGGNRGGGGGGGGFQGGGGGGNRGGGGGRRGR
jgi:23S rRNA pseudouridine2605 synthase